MPSPAGSIRSVRLFLTAGRGRFCHASTSGPSVKAKFVAAYTRSVLIHGLGPHGEMMVDAALSAAGFTVKAKDVREWNGRKWTLTDHDLDRIYERDGIEYGAEIKNTLPYIEKKLLLRKLDIAKIFNVRPFFIEEGHRRTTSKWYASGVGSH